MDIPKYFYFRVRVINKGTSVEVEDASDADVVEVVRCKDCKWYHNADDKYFPRTCDRWSEMFYHYEDWESVDENGFCSWGEKREDETN